MNFDESKYKVWTWKNPLVLHWIINPGIAINDVILGQRVPKITLVEKRKDKPFVERGYVPCPHCGTIHSSLKWSMQNKTAFKNWFGLYCDHCEKIIPCLRNLTSYLLLGISFPVWIWFKDKWKEKWLAEQKEKFSKPLILTAPEVKWWRVGLSWGLFMLVATSLFNLYSNDFTWKMLLIDIPLWMVGGLFFGFVMKKFFTSKSSVKSNTNQAPGAIE
jgi:hypothetical protein